jgi:hypothetical protein
MLGEYKTSWGEHERALAHCRAACQWFVDWHGSCPRSLPLCSLIVTQTLEIAEA